jgi:hypothetical protein
MYIYQQVIEPVSIRIIKDFDGIERLEGKVSLLT